EVADAHLAAGPDEQVGVGHPLRPEVLRDGASRDLVGLQLAPLDAPGDRAGGLRDVLAAAVAHREDHGHPRVVARRRDARPQRLADRRREPPQAADREQADLVPHHLAELAGEVLAEQLHQAVHLAGRTVPVLAGEGEEREVLDAELAARLDDGAHRLLAGAMPVEAGPPAPLRPPPPARPELPRAAAPRAVRGRRPQPPTLSPPL